MIAHEPEDKGQHMYSTSQTASAPAATSSRFQLSLNVADVNAAVEFYSKLLGVGPAKHRQGYANFVVENPPMKLVVIEDEGVPGSINHVGIEFPNGAAVGAETQRVTELGLPVIVDDPHTCCFATQEKAWTRDVDGVPWELYTVVGDTDEFGQSPHGTPLDSILPPATIDEVEAALAGDAVVVIDAQGSGGYEAAHMAGATNLGLEDVAGQARDLIADLDQPVIVYCTNHACLGAEFVGTQLVDAGYSNVRRLPGGIEEWAGAGQPVESGN